MAIRSFLALELPPEVQEALSGVWGKMRQTPLDVRWVKPSNIHLTVVFLGDVSPEGLARVKEVSEAVCARFGPFQVSVSGVGVFPGKRSPRVLWLGLEGDLKGMSRFREDLQDRLEPLGIRKEHRPFRPHLTLARFRKRASGADPHLREVLARYETYRGPSCALKELSLYRSDLGPAGARYTRLAGWRLSAGDGEPA
ncbi:MAG: RNA 2',3'-cyclic phosphodiesterase [Deltaproteobacteria bacterium]|nr:MAG: RNA 2',3'-cyclic phosphodiesterase [Deltaproteobacteria bacterium]